MSVSRGEEPRMRKVTAVVTLALHVAYGAIVGWFAGGF